MLRAVIVIDYQNIHLTGHNFFEHDGTPRHHSLVHPLYYARQLLEARNLGQRPGFAQAELHRVEVYRGLPSPVHEPNGYARNLAQKERWESDPRVQVSLRPLTYRYLYGADGRPIRDINGLKVRDESVPPQEKGVDVLCALALVRASQEAGVDLVIMASHDSDLVPALDEAVRLRAAKVETTSWYDPVTHRSQQLRPSAGTLWNTRLGREQFIAARDLTDYA